MALLKVIDTDEGGRRLARAILADITIYHPPVEDPENPQGPRKLPDLTEVMREGRDLYQQRVVPELHPLFDEVIRSEVVALRVPSALLGYIAPEGEEGIAGDVARRVA
jgi:hypothetical protein